MIRRPALFSPMGAAFTAVFGNVDAIPVVDGAALPAVRGILRQVRETDLLSDSGAPVEGVTHALKLAAETADGLVPQRDTVTIDGIAYAVRSKADDGRAMISLLLGGAI